MIDEQKLNKKLEEWADIKYLGDGRWLYGNIIHWQKPDNFTEFLDACLKWLVPKGKIEKVAFMFSANAVSCDIEANLKFYEGHVDVDNFAEAYKKSALALCLAIEKLIDSEAKK